MPQSRVRGKKPSFIQVITLSDGSRKGIKHRIPTELDITTQSKRNLIKELALDFDRYIQMPLIHLQRMKRELKLQSDVSL